MISQLITIVHRNQNLVTKSISHLNHHLS